MHRTVTSLTTASVALLVSLASGTASAATSGPDPAGYSYADQASGAVYNYVDITLTGALVTAGDDVFANVALGAPFTIYGAVQNNMTASSNGFLTDLAGGTVDLTNDCPMPFVPGAGAGSFRIAALHDDLVTTVRYQFFDQAQAAAVGYPGETAGISVFQWSGIHFGGPAAGIDVEVILFHDDDGILSMVAADSDGGTGSTMGIQNADASLGLNYGCNTGGYTIPGVTAVEYSVGTPPVSTCCAGNPSATPGCTNLFCTDLICATDPFCCSTQWDNMCANAAEVSCLVVCDPPPLSINEIRIDQTGVDNDEYFEISGPPGTPLDDVQYVVIGDAPTGQIETIVDLSGQVIPPSGLFVAAEGTFTFGVADFVTLFNFENTDTTTHMLVGGVSTNNGTNLDGDANGVLDANPWIVVFDTVAMLDSVSVDLPYGPPLNCVDGPFCQEVSDGADAPFQVYRCPDGTGTWQIGNDDLLALPATDTPGAGNTCPFCGDGAVDPGEDCDDAGESAVCNADCSFAACGDGQTNPTAGEDCDDSGESATCNLDCTTAGCGDGVTNATAGEDCDDAGESATCNADCSTAACGDGQTNVTAGEDCDDSGESASCNADCTTAACGDGVLNVTSGEACDDNGRSDMCNADCSIASCGDGVINVTAGESCDDSGESATCDDDCTAVMCGDSVTNTTAGEDCDDGGESATCNDDCTTATCGDGVLNPTAGEECDDSNTDDGDGCASDCTDEGAGSTGDSTGDSSSGDGSTGDSSGEGDTGSATDGDTGVDDTGGATDGDTGVDDSGSASATMTTAATTMTTAASADGGSDETGDTDTAGGVSSDNGCSCTTQGTGDTKWSVLALLGLAAIGRRRRRR